MRKVLFFDLDGTLTDPSQGIIASILHSLEHYGIRESHPEALRRFIGPPLKESFMQRYGFSQEKALEAVYYFREYFSTRGIYENRVYEGIPLLLQRLKAGGYTLALATSKPEEFARRVLCYFHIDPYFSAVCGASMDERERSEKRDVLRYAAETLSLLPEEREAAFMIGDHAVDMRAAKEMGMRGLGVAWGFGTAEELRSAGADLVLSSVGELEKELL